MASLSFDTAGGVRLLFIAADGRRRAVRLSRMTKRNAEAFKLRVEHLVAAQRAAVAPDPQTADWTRSLPDAIHARLARAGLVRARTARSLAAWCEEFMSSRAGLKPASRRKLEQTVTHLIERFGSGRPIHDIGPDDAATWKQDLEGSGLSKATVKTHVGNAKTIFAEALARELLERSPFQRVSGGVTPTRNTRYVTPEEMERVLEGCPDSQWRLLFGLARYAGLRVPSETELLTWADVDWDRARLSVRSPKTERHPGHEKRTVPIDPRLMRLLQERFDAAEEGDERLVSVRGAGGRRRAVLRILERAGVEPWDQTWQSLRRSCEIEWAKHHPQFAVSKWIGHSITVSGRHYANAVPDELFDRAARGVAQNPAQRPSASPRNGPRPATGANPPHRGKQAPCKSMRANADAREGSEKWSRGESNPRPGTVSRALLRVYPLL